LSVIAKERAETLLNGKIDTPRDDWIYGKNFFGRVDLHDNMPDAIEVFRHWYNEMIYITITKKNQYLTIQVFNN